MSNFIWLIFLNAIFLIMLSFTSSYVTSQQLGGKRKQECTMLKEKGFITADCQKSDFTLVPINLRTDIEVLYLTGNRMRKLPAESFKSYSSLRFLYLDDNIITHIDDDVFYATPSLEVLDLSLNPLTTLPVSLAQLPRLRRLYLSSTELPYTEIENFTRIAGEYSSLEYLSLNDINLKTMPPLGGLLTLQELNISHNSHLEMTPSNFGAACKLQHITMKGSMKALRQDSSCNCHALRLWFQQTNVQVIPETKQFECPQDTNSKYNRVSFDLINFQSPKEKECSKEADRMISEARQARRHCEARVQQRERTLKARMTWFWIGIGLGLFTLLFVIILLSVIWNRRRRQRNSSSTRATASDVRHDPVGETSAKLLDSSAAPATTPLDQKPIS